MAQKRRLWIPREARCSAPSWATARKEDQRVGEAQAAAHNMRCSALQPLAPATRAAAHQMGAAARPACVAAATRAAAHQMGAAARRACVAAATRAAAHQMGAAARPLDVTRCSAPMGAAARPSPLLCQKTQAAARFGAGCSAPRPKNARCSA